MTVQPTSPVYFGASVKQVIGRSLLLGGVLGLGVLGGVEGQKRGIFPGTTAHADTKAGHADPHAPGGTVDPYVYGQHQMQFENAGTAKAVLDAYKGDPQQQLRAFVGLLKGQPRHDSNKAALADFLKVKGVTKLSEVERSLGRYAALEKDYAAAFADHAGNLECMGTLILNAHLPLPKN